MNEQPWADGEDPTNHTGHESISTEHVGPAAIAGPRLPSPRTIEAAPPQYHDNGLFADFTCLTFGFDTTVVCTGCCPIAGVRY